MSFEKPEILKRTIFIYIIVICVSGDLEKRRDEKMKSRR